MLIIKFRLAKYLRFLVFMTTCIAALLLTAPGPAFSIGNLRVGSFGIHPLLTFGTLYSDNLLRVNTGTQSDVGFLITPGIIIENEREDRKLRLDYHSLIEEYVDLTSQNAVNHWVEASGHFELASGWMLEGLGRHRYDHDPQGTNIGEELDIFKENTLEGGGGYTFADVYRAEADLSYKMIDYKAARNAFRDRDELWAGGTFFYQFMPVTSALLELRWGDTQFDTNRTFDNNTFRVEVGATWDLTGKSTGTAKGGYALKDFNDATLDDFSGFVLGVEVEHHMDEWTSFRLDALRDVNETNMATANYYTTTGVGVEATHGFTEKIGSTLRLSYGLDEYSNDVTIGGVTKTRKDNTWIFQWDGVYKIQEWLNTLLRYEYRNRDSNFDSLSYSENRILFEISSVL